MTPEELEAIRRRVQDADDKWQGRVARRDRAALLAEVDRLTGVLDSVRADLAELGGLIESRQKASR